MYYNAQLSHACLRSLIIIDMYIATLT